MLVTGWYRQHKESGEALQPPRIKKGGGALHPAGDKQVGVIASHNGLITGRDDKDMGKNAQKPHDVAVMRIRDAIYTAKTRAGSVEALARQIGIPSRTLESYLSYEAKPSVETLCLLIDGLGASFLNELVEPLGVTGAYDKDPGKLTGMAVVGQLAHTSYLIAMLRKNINHFPASERRIIEHQLTGLLGQIEGGL